MQSGPPSVDSIQQEAISLNCVICRLTLAEVNSQFTYSAPAGVAQVLDVLCSHTALHTVPLTLDALFMQAGGRVEPRVQACGSGAGWRAAGDVGVPYLQDIPGCH